MGVTNLKKLLKHERNIYLDDLKRTVDNISSIRGVGVVDISGWLVTFLTSNLAIANVVGTNFVASSTSSSNSRTNSSSNSSCSVIAIPSPTST